MEPISLILAALLAGVVTGAGQSASPAPTRTGPSSKPQQRCRRWHSASWPAGM